MNAEQLLYLYEQSRRAHTFLNRDLCGWATPGTDMAKLERVVERLWQRCERRQSALERRLGVS